MTEPRRVLIDWEYLCDGICWVPDKEEHETPYPEGLRLREVQRPGGPPVIREWRERLSEQVLRDLKAWNDSWGSGNPPVTGGAARVLQERGRELAVRVQDELGTDGWEVLYELDGRVHRVHPPGSWPAETWQQELLGYRSRQRDMTVAAVVFTCPPKIAAAIDVTTGPCVPAPGERQPLVSVRRQQHGDRPEHLTALYQVLTGRPEAGAWADLKHLGEAMLATFSDDYRSALASLSIGQQDPPGKLTEFTIRWIETTNWPSSLPERLIFTRLTRMAERATRAAERQTPLYCWFGPAQPSRSASHRSRRNRHPPLPLIQLHGIGP